MPQPARRIHVFLPSLLATAAALKADYGHELKAPALLGMLNKLTMHKHKTTGFQSALYPCFGLTASSYADYCYRFEFAAQPDAQKTVLRATPIHLISGMTDIAVDQQPIDDLGAEDAHKLCAELNAHFATDGWEFRLSPRGNGYVLIPTEQVPASLLTLECILGQNLYSIVERSEDMRWNRMLNEIQMLLHGSAVNFKRESERQRTVSSMWLWGNDYLNAQPGDAEVDYVYGGGFEGEAFAHASQSAWQQDIPDIHQGAPAGTSIILLNEALRVGDRVDAEDFQTQLEQIDQQIFAPLAAQMGRGDEIVIHDSEGKFWQGNKNKLKMLFFRTKRSLLDYI